MGTGLLIAPGLDTFLTEFTLKEVKPDHVAFIATTATASQAYELISKHNLSSHKVFFVKDLFSTAETIHEFIHAFNWLRSKDVDSIYIDATNCITVIEMGVYISANLFDLYRSFMESSIDIRSIYVHTEFEEMDNGVFGEIRGTEKIVELEKPIHSLNFLVAMDGVDAFNNGRYSTARNIFSNLATQTVGNISLFYSSLESLASGYNLWDIMDIECAIDKIKEARESFLKVKKFAPVENMVATIENNIEVLESIHKEDELHVIVDLYVNALRRESSSRFDDALARMYSMVERIVHSRLLEIGVDPRNFSVEQLPVELKPEDVPKESHFGLKEGVKILLEVGSDSAIAPIADLKYAGFLSLLNIRNTSILAHGIKPVGAQKFERFHLRLAKPLLEAYLQVKGVGLDVLEKHTHISLDGILELLQQNR